MVDNAPRAEAAGEPDPRAAALLADAGLVLAPELDLGPGTRPRNRAQRRGEAPLLNRSCAAGFAFGWLGRVFCRERSSDFTSRSMPPLR